PAKEAPTAAAVAAPTATAVPVAAHAPAPATEAPAKSGANGAPTNGATAAAELAGATTVASSGPLFQEDSPEVKARKEMNRREFLTYAWGGALGLLTLQAGVGMFFFMMPRFKAGEFGGVFFIGPESALPPTSAPPDPFVAGKFWLVNTEDVGPKALYMVCTHLGCLYKWEQANNRFECPCHGSKFTREGFYIEGPAPRSLDTFVISIEGGEVAVDTGKKELGAPSADSPARAVPA
ncbi:MAG: Rieske 2Fe-2S domain-containing protein, partial [Caldilinea sp.]|nr:Rieske 2Fe-2S domain-containing protein [Caldilinea sp.]